MRFNPRPGIGVIDNHCETFDAIRSDVRLVNLDVILMQSQYLRHVSEEKVPYTLRTMPSGTTFS